MADDIDYRIGPGPTVRRDTQMTRVHDDALTVACPLCKAHPGAECVDRTVIKRIGVAGVHGGRHNRFLAGW